MTLNNNADIEMYKEILNEIAEGVIIYNNTGVISWCNNAANLIFSKKVKSIIGENIEGVLANHIFEKEYHVKKKWLDSADASVVFIKKLENNGHRELNNVPVRRASHNFEDIIGHNQSLCDIKILAKRAAFTQSPVLIYGETGTGKELFAQSIHNASCRAKSPFVAINCAAIPENLLEGILFGTVKGAYTEAVDRPGLFEQASDGTLFLDEINSMSLLLQAKLLRVLQEKKIRRVGGMTDIEVNPRIISSVNMKPLEAIEKGLLRSDLFYRLGVVCLGIPPLRERTDDLPYLIDFFIKKVSRKLAKGRYTAANDLLRVFQSYNWPGNVRQLEHALECAITLISSNETEITIEHIPEYMKITSTITIKEEPLTRKFNLNPLDSEIEKVEKNKIITVLEDTKGNISLAARLMNISRQSLHYRMKKHQIRVSR